MLLSQGICKVLIIKGEDAIDVIECFCVKIILFHKHQGGIIDSGT